MTLFNDIYEAFLRKITDDMYLEWTPEDTKKDLQNILLDSIPKFEFPKFSPYDYDLELEQYNVDLTPEEIHILSLLMVQNWLQRQINSIENIRMKYSGADFKMTSQANHLSKLLELKKNIDNDVHHYQRLYGRRETDKKGKVRSTWYFFGKGEE